MPSKSVELEEKIVALLNPYANPKRAAHDIGYMKSAYELMGVSVPQLRKTAKELVKSLDQNIVKARKTLTAIWGMSKTFDVLYVVLLSYDLLMHDPTLEDWKTLKGWSKRIDNWAHSDMLSSMYAKLLETFPKEIYPTFVEWNQSKLPWRRRLSLTSLVYYARGRKRFLPITKILKLVKPRIGDDHFYVQRAVGWTLREAYNVYPGKTAAFIKKYVEKFSSIAFTTAVEKFSKEKKEVLKQVRKRARKKA